MQIEVIVYCGPAIYIETCRLNNQVLDGSDIYAPWQQYLIAVCLRCRANEVIWGPEKYDRISPGQGQFFPQSSGPVEVFFLFNFDVLPQTVGE